MNLQSLQKGFTLVEAVIVIAIAGIVATMVAVFITQPVEGLADLSRRAELVDASELALKRMQRDIRQALPNSLRIKNLGVGSGQVIEFLHVRSGGRYRINPGGAGYSAAECRLSFNPAGDNSFAVMGTLSEPPQANDRIVISNWNTIGTIANAYASPADNTTPASTAISFTPGGGTCTEDTIGLSANFTFAHTSPQQRFYIVDTPVTYLCNTANGTLTRYENYNITTNHSDIDTAAELLGAGPGVSSALVTEGITACNFSYAPGTPSRSGLVTISTAVSQDGENIFLQQQFHVSNIP